MTLRRLLAGWVAGLVAAATLCPVGCGPGTSSSGPPAAVQQPGAGGPAADDKLPPDAPVVKMTADEFMDEFKKDKDASYKKLAKSYVMLTGTVSFFGAGQPDGSTRSSVDLSGKRNTGDVICELMDKDKEPWAKVAWRQSVTVKGRVPLAPLDQLRDCEIVDQGPSTVVVTTAPQLADEFAANKQATADKYSLTPFIVTGDVVDVVDKYPPYNLPAVLLKGNDKATVACELWGSSQWMKDRVSKGQKIKLYGTWNTNADSDKVGLHNCLTITQP